MFVNEIILSKIFPNYLNSLSTFDNSEITKLDFYEKIKDSGKWYVKSFSRGHEEKLILNTTNNKKYPEEIVRQLFINRLIKKYRYPKNLIDIEKRVNFGRNNSNRADIVIFNDDNVTPLIIIETKAPGESNDIKQLKSYMNAEGAPLAVGLNGQTQIILFRPYPKEFDDTLYDIPKYGETVEDVLNKKLTITNLSFPGQLTDLIIDIEELVLANSGYDSFEEIFKLIFAKLFDESEGISNPEKYELSFRKHPSKDSEKTKDNIDKLFENSKIRWPGVFDKKDLIKLKSEHLSVCVGALENFRLLGANLQIIDDAFEYLIPSVAKKKKGQYFTPRNLIDMCIKILNPTKNENIIDTACGSGGFLIHSMNHMKSKYNFNNQQLSNYAKDYLYGIDFDEKLSKIAKAMMLIAGDGKSHIYKANSLEGTDSEWTEISNEFKNINLFKEFDDFDENKRNQKDNLFFNFDILLANPPFAGEVKETKTINKYLLGKKNGKNLDSISRHVLYIERNLNFVKDGGRLAIVLPQGIFNNPSQKHIREFIMERARIIAVVGIPQTMFKPHTDPKTSVIFLQKWHEKKCPKVNEYNIFMATSVKSGKDSSGNYIYKKDENGVEILDSDGNRKIDHDLEQISSEFIKYAKKEKFSFFNE